MKNEFTIPTVTILIICFIGLVGGNTPLKARPGEVVFTISRIEVNQKTGLTALEINQESKEGTISSRHFELQQQESLIIRETMRVGDQFSAKPNSPLFSLLTWARSGGNSR